MNTECQNCGRPLEGGFCSQCGQSGKDYDLPVGAFAKDFASETLSLDSRLRLTLQRLVLEPGAVPKEYVAGHRTRFVPPVRLYVFASFAMFLLLSIRPGVVNISASNQETPSEAVADSGAAAGTTPDSTAPGEASSTWGQRFATRFFDALRRVAADSERFGELFLARMAQAMFFLLPAFAALLKVVYRRRLYMHHLVFSIYLHSFAFLLLALAAIPSAMGLESVSAVTDLAILWIPIYLFLGMRRFYGQSRMKTLLKFGLVSVAYWLLGTVTAGGLLVFSLMTY